MRGNDVRMNNIQAKRRLRLCRAVLCAIALACVGSIRSAQAITLDPVAFTEVFRAGPTTLSPTAAGPTAVEITTFSGPAPDHLVVLDGATGRVSSVISIDTPTATPGSVLVAESAWPGLQASIAGAGTLSPTRAGAVLLALRGGGSLTPLVSVFDDPFQAERLAGAELLASAAVVALGPQDAHNAAVDPVWHGDWAQMAVDTAEPIDLRGVSLATWTPEAGWVTGDPEGFGQLIDGPWAYQASPGVAPLPRFPHAPEPGSLMALAPLLWVCRRRRRGITPGLRIVRAGRKA
ncbi:MAG: hypothetical protein AAF288_11160 [Planctomycetota bacterium]